MKAIGEDVRVYSLDYEYGVFLDLCLSVGVFTYGCSFVAISHSFRGSIRVAKSL